MQQTFTIPERRITTLSAVLVSITVGGAGIALLYVTGLDLAFWVAHRGLQTLLMQIASLMIVSVAVAFVWELFGRRVFLNEMLAIAGVSQDLRAAGILRVANSPNQIEWGSLINGATSIDVFFTYGRSWRGHYDQQLKGLPSRPATVLRAILPDPEDKLLMKSLGARFCKEPAVLVKDIHEAAEFFSGLAESAGGDRVQIWYTKAAPVVSIYRFDGVAVVALYPHKAKVDLPHFICGRGGSLFAYAMDQLTVLCSEQDGLSRRLAPAKPSV
ncbi:MAG: hypothetical protein U1E73_09625 [Planctomycetota bacterium]